MSELMRLLQVRKALGIFVVSIVALLAAGVLVSRSVTPTPSLDRLKAFDASITSVATSGSRGSKPAKIEFRFSGKTATYSYPGSFPSREALDSLRVGDRVRVWSDVGETYSVFQIELGGVVLLAYEDAAEGWRRQKRSSWIYVAVLIGAAVTGAISLSTFRLGAREDRNG